MRLALGALGVVLMGAGAWLLLAGERVRDPWEVLLWLAGAIALHDGVIAPLVLAVGLFLVGARARGVLRGALIVAGSLTVIALPLLLRPGAPANPSALPLDYVRNWLLTLTTVAVVTVGLLLVRRLRRRGSRPGRQGVPGSAERW
ncbi:hypothetical protein [Streptomyces sp. H27-C3]|uniref:hypothetical protein n=1 Tax=Streptomyces sp. H27-C3 TaxID=3046305 RepID=UPI0024B8C8DD|nr:hypothetical protein [Streptomyces sp. H27-C3]MDJ0466947.1 hypothetical protein [Streptomyces sp. H27-C3]